MCVVSPPDEWHNSITIPIFKNEQKICSLFTSILKNKLETQMKNAEEQQGFTKERSITDAVFKTKGKSIEYSIPAYICFIDLTKAFDRGLGNILHILIENKAPANITNIIHNLNNNNRI